MTLLSTCPTFLSSVFCIFTKIKTILKDHPSHNANLLLQWEDHHICPMFNVKWMAIDIDREIYLSTSFPNHIYICVYTDIYPSIYIFKTWHVVVPQCVFVYFNSILFFGFILNISPTFRKLEFKYIKSQKLS